MEKQLAQEHDRKWQWYSARRGLDGCNCHTCTALFWPCGVYGRVSQRIRATLGGRDPVNIGQGFSSPDCLQFAICLPFYGCFIARLQTTVREFYNISGSDVGDWCDGCICPCITLVRNEQEVLFRERPQIHIKDISIPSSSITEQYNSPAPMSTPSSSKTPSNLGMDVELGASSGTLATIPETIHEQSTAKRPSPRKQHAPNRGAFDRPRLPMGLSGFSKATDSESPVEAKATMHRGIPKSDEPSLIKGKGKAKGNRNHQLEDDEASLATRAKRAHQLEDDEPALKTRPKSAHQLEDDDASLKLRSKPGHELEDDEAASTVRSKPGHELEDDESTPTDTSLRDKPHELQDNDITTTDADESKSTTNVDTNDDSDTTKTKNNEGNGNAKVDADESKMDKKKGGKSRPGHQLEDDHFVLAPFIDKSHRLSDDESCIEQDTGEGNTALNPKADSKSRRGHQLDNDEFVLAPYVNKSHQLRDDDLADGEPDYGNETTSTNIKNKDKTREMIDSKAESSQTPGHRLEDDKPVLASTTDKSHRLRDDGLTGEDADYGDETASTKAKNEHKAEQTIDGKAESSQTPGHRLEDDDSVLTKHSDRSHDIKSDRDAQQDTDEDKEKDTSESNKKATSGQEHGKGGSDKTKTTSGNDQSTFGNTKHFSSKKNVLGNIQSTLGNIKGSSSNGSQRGRQSKDESERPSSSPFNISHSRLRIGRTATRTATETKDSEHQEGQTIELNNLGSSKHSNAEHDIENDQVVSQGTSRSTHDLHDDDMPPAKSTRAAHALDEDEHVQAAGSEKSHDLRDDA